MKTNRATSPIVRQYLAELATALAEAPSPGRSDLLADVEAELEGLDDHEAKARIAQLGDPRMIAADAAAAHSSQTDQQSRAYPVVTILLLIFGGYLIPVLGWLVGLFLIARGPGWVRAVRRRAVIGSILGALLSLSILWGLHAFGHGSSLTVPALVLLTVLPFVVNVLIGRYLNRRWWRSPEGEQA